MAAAVAAARGEQVQVRSRSEIDLPAHSGEAGVHHRGRPQPGRAVGLEVSLGDVRVHQVEDVDANLRPTASESQKLGDTEIDLVDAVAKERLRATRFTVTLLACPANGRPSVCAPWRSARPGSPPDSRPAGSGSWNSPGPPPSGCVRHQSLELGQEWCDHPAVPAAGRIELWRTSQVSVTARPVLVPP